MKSKIAPVLFAFCLFFLYSCEEQISFTDIPKQDRIDLAMEQEFFLTHDPKTGTVPKEKLIAARAYADDMRAYRAPIANIDWVERGP